MQVTRWFITLVMMAFGIVGFGLPTYSYSQQNQDRAGSCLHTQFQYNPDGQVSYPFPIKALREGAPIYENADGNKQRGTLAFSRTLYVTDVRGNRIQIKEGETQRILGWAERIDLLCALSPLRGSSGLKQIFYIPTSTDPRSNKPATVSAYPSSNMDTCDGKCRELSTLDQYFVFDVDLNNNSYLVANNYQLDETSLLIGWVSPQNGFIWDTALGMRPKEDLRFPADYPTMPRKERSICAYRKLEDAILETKTACIPILGGKRWYLNSGRIPILGIITEQGKEFYHVVLPFSVAIPITDKDRIASIKVDSEMFEINKKTISSDEQQVNELVLELSGGVALTEVIEKLKGNEEYQNVPGLFWELIEQGSCHELGEQCQNRIVDTIVEAYIPVSDNVDIDVWLTSDELDKFTELLRTFAPDQLAGVSGTELRATFTHTMLSSLENVIRKPTYEGGPISGYLKWKGGLPVSDMSPLFHYSIDDLNDPVAVPDCELIRLLAWIKSSQQMLDILYHGDLRPSYQISPYEGDCPSGQNIPYIAEDVQAVPLGKNPEMRDGLSFQHGRMYWVPLEFLP